MDVGANAGVFSHLLARINPRASIYAIEPLPAMAARLRKLGTDLGMNLHVIEGAASDRPGQASLYAASADDTCASLTPQDRTVGTYQVATWLLDEIVPVADILVIKIDTERHEMAVLRGAGDTLKRARFLIVEVLSDGELPPILEHLGDTWEPRRISPGDFLFTRTPAAPPAA